MSLFEHWFECVHLTLFFLETEYLSSNVSYYKFILVFLLSASAVSKNSSRTSNSSAPSSLTIPSYSDRSSVSSLPTPRTEGEILSSPNLKAFTFNELKNATRNFRPDSLLGEGGFGYVFKGWIDENTFTAAKPGSGMVVAVKRLKPEGFQGHKEWLVGFFFSFLKCVSSLFYTWLIHWYPYSISDRSKLSWPASSSKSG